MNDKMKRVAEFYKGFGDMVKSQSDSEIMEFLDLCELNKSDALKDLRWGASIYEIYLRSLKSDFESFY